MPEYCPTGKDIFRFLFASLMESEVDKVFKKKKKKKNNNNAREKDDTILAHRYLTYYLLAK